LTRYWISSLLGFGFLGLLSTSGVAMLQADTPPDKPAIAALGLDHVIVAVNDLEKAAQRYQDLGFSLKPGRPHDNGIRNQHVKFPDGIEIELLTAPEARDDLTAKYRRHLEGGDGPAFYALYASETDAAVRRLDAAGVSHRRNGGLISLPDGHPLKPLFFSRRNQSPTDRPEHFAHPNTAQTLTALWLAGDLAPERNLLSAFGGTVSRRPVRVPEPVNAEVVAIQEAEIYLLPASRQLLPGRKIVGVTVSVRSLAAARAALRISIPQAAATDGSLFLPPSVTHGIWIELREVRPD
jgi:catechol 2,3-dioxygenase-like lactoylglutathione lyase family enzyme